MTLEDNQDAPTSPTQNRVRGRRFLVTVGIVAALAIAGVWLLLPERFDLGTRRMMTFVILVLAAVCEAAWFFSVSRFPRRAKWIGGSVLAVGLVFLLLSIRRVEFSGDMVPTLDFRWSVDRDDVLEAHRASQQDAQAKTGARDVAAIAERVAERPADWNVLEYRGPKRDGIVTGPKLARDWKSQPPKLVFRQPVGGGYASFVVDGSRLVTIEQRRDKEAVVAYDFDTGREHWVRDYTALFSEQLGGDGPRATPTIHNGRVYALGATGILTCLDLNSGAAIWSLNILSQDQVANLDWGMSGSPLILDDIVIVNPGTQKGSADSRGVTTFDTASGEPRWASGSSKASYASPMLVTLAGTPQILIFDGVGLAGLAVSDGAELWRTPWKSDFDINAAQPVVLDGDRIFISSAAGSAVYHVVKADDKWSVEEVWKTTRMKCGYSCPIAYQGYVYGIDENLLACVDLADGKRMWKERQGQFGHGQILLSGDLLIVMGEAGELALVEATPERYHELGRIQAIEGKTWNNPTLVGNRIFVRNHLEMAAYDLPLAE
jgi:outer membrane protein assembly factor BamB